MNFLQYEFDLDQGDAVEVVLDKQANVRLLDKSNFQNYVRGQQHRYYGGHAQTSPFRVVAPSRGHWYLVIDLGGYPGSVKASVRMSALHA